MFLVIVGSLEVQNKVCVRIRKRGSENAMQSAKER